MSMLIRTVEASLSQNYDSAWMWPFESNGNVDGRATAPEKSMGSGEV